jgi:hypothetical protein
MFTTLLEVAGLGCLVAAAFCLAIPAGLAALGVALLVVAYGVNR